ncbi:PspC domain-containing protein [Streptomyces megasporus]|uniref:PspC domain-containing protein n=1 Tax=Streptomyces megasporus TaxID=44060 RepID=UPI000D11DC26|nr:PspC domain-containing protein [Streptomyces megasporus]
MNDAQPTDGESVPEPDAGQRLSRSRRHKVVAGVCGGLGRHYGLDPVIFRVPLAVLSVVGGLGLFLYGFAWLLVPLEGEDENEGRRLLSGRVEGTSLSAVLCALVGCGLILTSMGNDGSDTQMFSLALVGALAGAAHWSRQRHRATDPEAEGGPVDPVTAQVVADAPPETKAPPVPAGPSWWREPLTKDGLDGRPYDTGYLWGPEDTAFGPSSSGTERADGPPPPSSTAPRERTSIGGPLFLLAVAAAVLGTAVAWPTQPLGPALAVGLGCALGVFGLGTAVSAFYGRVGAGTITAIACTGALLAGALALPKDITTDWADARWRPAAADRIDERYELGSGSATLDLSRVEFEEGRTVRTAVDVGAGEVRVVVPDDVEVEVTVEVGVGGYQLHERPGTGMERGSGYGGGIGLRDRRTLPPADGDAPFGTLELRLDVGVGQATVVRHPREEGR